MTRKKALAGFHFARRWNDFFEGALKGESVLCFLPMMRAGKFFDAGKLLAATPKAMPPVRTGLTAWPYMLIRVPGFGAGFRSGLGSVLKLRCLCCVPCSLQVRLFQPEKVAAGRASVRRGRGICFCHAYLRCVWYMFGIELYSRGAKQYCTTQNHVF